MVTLAIGAVVLIAALAVLGRLSTVDPKLLVLRLTQIGGGVMIAAGLGLSVTGRFMVGAPLIFMGLSMLGWLPGTASFAQRTRRSTGRVSRVRTGLIEMELDHDSGAMRGTVLNGPFAGQSLDTLTDNDLFALVRAADDDSRALLAAYLDRRSPGWREHDQTDSAPRSNRPSGSMTEQEAYQILGL